MPSVVWTGISAVGSILAASVPAVLFLIERKDRKSAQKALEIQLREQSQAERKRAAREAHAEVRRISIWNEVVTS